MYACVFHITAPITGPISRHQVSIGNLISGGESEVSQPCSTTIVSLDPIYFILRHEQKRDYLAYQRATAKEDALDARQYAWPFRSTSPTKRAGRTQGHINFIENQVDRTAGRDPGRAPSSPILISCLRQAQFGRIRIPGSNAYKAI